MYIPSTAADCCEDVAAVKMGYTYKNGIDIVDEEQLFRLEKFRFE